VGLLGQLGQLLRVHGLTDLFTRYRLVLALAHPRLDLVGQSVLGQVRREPLEPVTAAAEQLHDRVKAALLALLAAELAQDILDTHFCPLS
jgi:hypothetical protein